MKKHLLAALSFALILSMGGNSASLPYPAANLKFKGLASAPSEGCILEISQPAEFETLSKWCTIEITMPGELKYNPNLSFEGKCIVNADQTPTHVSCLISTGEGKVGFIMLNKNPATKSELPFQANFKGVTIPPDSKSSEPWSEKDVITKIRIYSSFASPVQSKFTLQEFKIKNAP